MKKKNKTINKIDFEFIIIAVLIVVGTLFIKFYNVPVVNNQYVFLGDSITFRYELQKYYSKYPIINSGTNGDRTIDILENLDNRVYKYNPDKLILLIGVNDLAHEQSVDYVFNNIKKITDDIHNKYPKCNIYIQSIYPVNEMWKQQAAVNSPSLEDMNDRIKEVNENIKKLCKTNNYKYVDVYSSLVNTNGVLNEVYSVDGIHLSDEGYRVATYIIKKNIID